MKTLILTLLLSLALPSTSAFSSDEWLCSHPQTSREGNQIKACGIAVAPNSENNAMGWAFYEAQVEFTRVCQNSTDCKGKKITVTPKRSECKKVMGVYKDGRKELGYKCERLVVFTIEG